MRRLRGLLALLLVLALAAANCAYADNEWKADIGALMHDSKAPDFAEKVYAIETGEDTQPHTIACRVAINTEEYGFEFVFVQDGIRVSDWSDVQNWLGGIVKTAASTAGADAKGLVQGIDKAIGESIRGTALDEVKPVWAEGNLKLKRVTVSSPFYPRLSSDDRGMSVQELQQRLIVLGFLNDTADGFFGGNTRDAVRDAQEYVRMLEEEAIKKHEAEATPTPKVTHTPTPEPTATAEPTPQPTHELMLIPRETPIGYLATPTIEPTEAPSAMPVAEDIDALQPQTTVNGVADAELQAFLFSWSFPTVHRELENGTSGKDVKRLQTRLKNLGYLTETPDGLYGSSTDTAVRAFQRRNGVQETGKANAETQRILFSVNAQAPAHAALQAGMKGDAVTELQEALWINGFSTFKADGTYGEGTKAAVESCQHYLNETTNAGFVENGVADSLLLEQLLDTQLPVGGVSVGKGSKGTVVKRLQRRLIGLGYMQGTADGNFGDGTASAISYFQRQHRLAETGTADVSTMAVLYSANAGKALKPYLLKVSIADQRVYAYALDENNQYTVLERTMVCSTGKKGSDTPTGTYESTTGPGARWHYFTKFDCWAQYAYYIQGDIMFHSVLFGQKDGKVTQSSVNNLGKRASHGCVRLAVEDAKWIYQNCPKNTRVEIN